VSSLRVLGSFTILNEGNKALENPRICLKITPEDTHLTL